MELTTLVNRSRDAAFGADHGAFSATNEWEQQRSYVAGLQLNAETYVCQLLLS